MPSSSFISLIHRWNAYWFAESAGVQLAVCRVVVVAAQLFLFFPALDSQLMFLRPFGGFIDPQILIVSISKLLPDNLFPTVAALTIIYWTTVAAGITTLIGFLTRSSALVFALGNWILVAHKYSYGEDHHPEAILCIFLLLLAFSPSGLRLSIDAVIRRWRRESADGATQGVPATTSNAVWPVKLIQVLLCFAYVSTGLAKVVYGGLAWMNGYTLQQIIFSSAVARDIPLGIWLAQQHTACMILSVGVILLEVFFFVSLLLPRTLPFFLLGGAMMHLGIYFAEGSPFFQYIVLYVVFIDFEKLHARVRAAWQRLPAPVEARV
jgi:uncharacterized membrane protein YphA (DoxX/SURF4 family)